MVQGIFKPTSGGKHVQHIGMGYMSAKHYMIAGEAALDDSMYVQCPYIWWEGGTSFSWIDEDIIDRFVALARTLEQ